MFDVEDGFLEDDAVALITVLCLSLADEVLTTWKVEGVESFIRFLPFFEPHY